MVHGAACLADHVDPAALHALSAALSAQPVNTKPTLLGNQKIVELCATIEELGGPLTPSQKAKREQVDALRERERATLLGVPARKARIRRNDHCPCGSRKKRKKRCGA